LIVKRYSIVIIYEPFLGLRPFGFVIHLIGTSELPVETEIPFAIGRPGFPAALNPSQASSSVPNAASSSISVPSLIFFPLNFLEIEGIEIESTPVLATNSLKTE